MIATTEREKKLSLLAAFGAYGVWGILPLYWHALNSAPAFEIMCHRVFWSFLLLLIMVSVSGQLRASLRIMAKRRSFLIFLCTSASLMLNWSLYIWAVNNGHVLDASLGYYINPILNVLGGVLVFKDRLNRLQMLSIVIATLGVLCQVVTLGSFPWIALVLAFSFAFYGIVRKLVEVDSMKGLFIESSIMLPFVSAWLIYLWINGQHSFGRGMHLQDAMLVGTSIITTGPLIWFAYSAMRLSLVTMGLIQYLTPSMAFLLGVFVFHEPFKTGHLLSFLFIWLALAIYTFDGIRSYRQAVYVAKGKQI